MQYFFIGDEETAIGFRLAGIEFAVVTDKQSCNEIFQKTVQNKNFAIILITEQAADLIRNQVNHYLFSVDFPLICEIPGIDGHTKHHTSLYELANQAIGLKI